MRIAVAQLRSSESADALEGHLHLALLARREGARGVVFPELSFTGYRPSHAERLATTIDGPHLRDLGAWAADYGLGLAVGVPLVGWIKSRIGVVLLEPDRTPRAYLKTFLHPDEQAFFEAGTPGPEVRFLDEVALAVCFELSVPRHAEETLRRPASVYAAPSAKSLEGVTAAHDRLACVARDYGVFSLFANAVGPCEGFVAGGGSAAWGRDGRLLARLDDTSEGVLVLDTEASRAWTIAA